MKKSFIIYTFIIFIFSSFSIFAEREAKLEELKYNEETELMYVNDEKEPFTGIAKDFYEDNSLKVEYPHKNGKIEGLAKEYYPNGKLKSEENFVDGLLNGKAITYYENGNIEYEENYKDGKLEGEIVFYDENGNMELKAIYKDDKVDKVIDVKTGEEISDEKNKFEDCLEYSIFGVIIALYIFFIIFKFKSFPKTSNLSDEQREKILKILIQNDENKKEIFSASKFYGIGTGYSKVASLVVDSQEVYIKAKIFSFLFIPVPIVLGYLLCYDEDQILASYSKTTFKEVKKKIQETILHL
ncbi:toxin-antitoxin system YwqK family antitoxin [Fusobacterium periodonticum]|uniref:toxin-antitoxin system YwqK family antitoxin n=1 Tax=Fusobacterium periodonticum TaxID=860 RepID=UPI00352F500D